MKVINLIAKAGALDAALVSSLQSAWGGGDAVWLAPDECAEFPVDLVPGNFRTVWEDLQAQGVDLNAVQSEGRKKAILLADMDSTMVGQECIDELAAEAGVGAQVADITARAMNGELDFEGALIERVGLLKGLDCSVIETVLKDRITFAPGGKALVATMRANGGYAALVSGGFTAFSGPISAALGFDEHKSNTLIEADGKLTGEVGRPILGREAKVNRLKTVAAKRGLTPVDALAVGDGANDLGMLQLAGMGVAVHAKPTVQAQSKLRINHGDLTALLFLQGYARDEFVS